MKIEKRYIASEDRYDQMIYRRCGNSGIILPIISLGLWHNFGFSDNFETAREILHTAFDHGITHFDLANNYGPPYGSAEQNFGMIMDKDFRQYRDEMIISSKAGYDMWPGPYGNYGSRKYLIASCDQSLKRMGLKYLDIFYHHRPDPGTPLEETMRALDYIVRSGRALYVGISNYPPELTKQASNILKGLGTPCLIHQPRYSMLDRWVENGLLDVLENESMGAIVFSPLAQGLLTNKYLNGIPGNSRAAKSSGALSKDQVTDEILDKVKRLSFIAKERNQSLAQMAIAWLLKDERITSVLIGASSQSQLLDSLGAIKNHEFSSDELDQINQIIEK
ncbi:MAG: L-glyceraldehyde 3-phosphate reductase [bacterium]